MAATPGESRLIRDATGFDGDVFALTFGKRRSDAMYRVEGGAAGAVFVKLLQPSGRAAGERAERIARWLLHRGVPVAVALDGYPRSLPDGRLVVAMPFLEGRCVTASISDMQALGATLAGLHRALGEHPDKDVWSQKTAHRLRNLAEIRSQLAARERIFGPEPARLSSLAAEASLDFALPRLPAQPLHGDLNPGNVLMVGGQPTWLDLEDVEHSVLPPVFELALAVERFVLVHVPHHEQAVDLGRALLGAYKAGGGASAVFRIDPVEVLRSLALRSLLTLACDPHPATKEPAGEWQKFYHLERQAVARARTIRQIFEGF